LPRTWWRGRGRECRLRPPSVESETGSNDGGGNTRVRALTSSRSNAAVGCSFDAKRHPRIATMPAPHPAVIGFCQSGQKILGATHDRPCRHGPWKADTGVYRCREIPWIGSTSRCSSGGLARLSSEPTSATHLTCTHARGWGRRIQRPDQRCRPTQRRWRARSGVVLLRGDASLLEAGVVEASPHRQHGTLRRLSYQRSIRHRVSASFASQRACQVIIRRLRAKPDTFCIFRRLCGRNARGRALGQDRTSWRPMSAS